MTYSEDDLIPLSGLQHLLFCERQCALIHIEQAWAGIMRARKTLEIESQCSEGELLL